MNFTYILLFHLQLQPSVKLTWLFYRSYVRIPFKHFYIYSIQFLMYFQLVVTPQADCRCKEDKVVVSRRTIYKRKVQNTLILLILIFPTQKEQSISKLYSSVECIFQLRTKDKTFCVLYPVQETSYCALVLQIEKKF